MKKNVAIIGGGASGLVCALVASRGGCEVTIIEKNPKPAKKILVSGNGRCNITNENICADNYHGGDPGFVVYALKRFGIKELKNFFGDLGLEFVSVDDGRIFPMSLQASSVVDILVHGCKREGVKFLLNKEVKEIKKEKKFVSVYDGGTLESDCVVVASGSYAMAKLGGSGIGYEIARSFSHRIIPTFSSLVQLKSGDSFCRNSCGVKIKTTIKVYVDREFKKEIFGDLLFTDYGVSGLAVLDVSRIVSFALSKKQKVSLKIDLLPHISHSSLKNILANKSKKFKNMPLSLWLNGMLHKKLVFSLLKRLKLKDSGISGMKDIRSLSYAIKNLVLDIEDTKGYESGEVVAGGVDLSRIDRKSMESKLQKGLFFTGEVLDIDGERGGYNLHWAFASGFLAGNSLVAL